MGRPPVPSHLKRDQRLVVMLTKVELERLQEAAANAGAVSVSEWVRERILDTAE